MKALNTVRPRRSILYVPGANLKALAKAASLPADGLIFDLEDAVLPEAKPAARKAIIDLRERFAASEEQAKTRNEWDACHGLKLKFSNPETGDFAMPTIGTFIQMLPKGFKTARYRSTDATVFAAIEGKGRTRIGEQTFEWGARDLFVVPSWQWVTHEADVDSVLFSFSDRPVQQKLDLFRDDRGNA